jgi:hypothetical protein
MGKRDYKKGSLSFDFIPLPKLIVRSPEWFRLPAGAKALAISLAAQYTGNNNGRLTPSYTAMKNVGWSSKDVLKRARDALLDTSFVIQTRAGKAPRTAEWIAFTWWPLNHHPSMEIDPRRFPHLNFKTIEAARIDPNTGRDRARGEHFEPPGIRGNRAPKTPSGPPESGAMTPDAS